MSTVSTESISNDVLAQQKTVFAPDLLRGQVIVVTGAGSGIGRATAWLAARLGAQVVLSGRSEEKLVTVADAMRECGLDADVESLDIREPARVDAALDAIFSRHERVDMLVNSAGGQFPQAAIDYSLNGWHSVINTNLNGTFFMMHGVARRWRRCEQSGNIVNVVVVQRGLHGVAHTLAARAGVIAFSQAVAVEWAPYGIRVNCVAPGPIRTEGWVVYSRAAQQKYPATNPMMRPGSPWEIAEAIIYLGGPGGAFVNGEVLVVDGGGRHWGEIWTTGKPEYYARASRLWDEDTIDP